MRHSEQEFGVPSPASAVIRNYRKVCAEDPGLAGAYAALSGKWMSTIQARSVFGRVLF